MSVDIQELHNIANFGKGSAMTKALHKAADALKIACEERDRAMTDAATFAAKWHDEERRADNAHEERAQWQRRADQYMEERDRFRKDSEALDWLLKQFSFSEDMVVMQLNHPYRSMRIDACHEHLRKRLEGK